MFYGSTGSLRLQRPVVGIVPTADRGGYWLDAADGGVFAFGDSSYDGSLPGLGLHPAGSGLPHSLDAPIVGMVPSADGAGYFMVASDGGVFAFGDAKFAGSCPGLGGCAGAAVAVMPDATGNGYWVVTKTGSVYAFGDAPYFGGPGPQSVPVASAVRTPDGGGYWILFANGAVYAYGDATSYGSPAGQFGGLNPASAIFATADGGGYWVASADGSVESLRRRTQRRLDARHPAQRLDRRGDGLVARPIRKGSRSPLPGYRRRRCVTHGSWASPTVESSPGSSSATRRTRRCSSSTAAPGPVSRCRSTRARSKQLG